MSKNHAKNEFVSSFHLNLMNIIGYTVAFESNDRGYVIFYRSFCNLLHIFWFVLDLARSRTVLDYAIRHDILHLIFNGRWPMVDEKKFKRLDENWERALAVVAHPDDLEYGAASAVARWTSQGKQVSYLKVLLP
jgi:hypothetical protein